MVFRLFMVIENKSKKKMYHAKRERRSRQIVFACDPTPDVGYGNAIII